MQPALTMTLKLFPSLTHAVSLTLSLSPFTPTPKARRTGWVGGERGNEGGRDVGGGVSDCQGAIVGNVRHGEREGGAGVDKRHRPPWIERGREAKAARERVGEGELALRITMRLKGCRTHKATDSWE